MSWEQRGAEQAGDHGGTGYERAGSESDITDSGGILVLTPRVPEINETY